MSIDEFFFQQVAAGAWRRGDKTTFGLGIRGMELADQVKRVKVSAMSCGARAAKEHVAAHQGRDAEIERLTRDASDVSQSSSWNRVDDW
jgi:hypothetical protein